MPGNSVGTVWVDVRFNVGDAGRQLQAALAGATAGGAAGPGAAAANFERTWQQSFAAVGAGATKLGRTMTIGLTVPLAALGKSAVSSFQEFDKAMTQIAALNAVPVAQTEQWREEVRQLGLEYGVAAEEAAQALYFITSSGQEGARAMSTLNVAVKASAVGLGETKVVADVLTSAMSAYQDEALTAAKAGDVLAAAVHYGKGEADELAGALSQVVPIAANVGVSFGEVAGAMAAMTLSGTSADQAATQMRGLFNTLQDMPPIAQRALEAYTGLSYQTLRHQMTEEGLIPVLKKVYDGFHGNNEAMAEVFGNIRALTGVFNLFGQNSEQTLKIVEAVTKASGDLNRAWEITAKSRSKQLELSMNRVHDSMIEMGANMAPLITTVTSGIGTVAQAFTALPEPIQAGALAFGALTAAAGPALMIFGQLTTAIPKVAGAFSTALPTLSGWVDTLRLKRMYSQEAATAAGGLTGKIGGLSGAMTIAGGAVAGLAAGYVLWTKAINDAANASNDLQTLIQAKAGGGGTERIDDVIRQTRDQIKALENEASATNLARLNPFNLDYFQASGENIDRMYETIRALEERKRISREAAEAMGLDVTKVTDWVSAQADAGNKLGTTNAVVKALGEALGKTTDDTDAFRQGLENTDNALTGLISRAKTAADAFMAIHDAQNRVEEARRGVTEARERVTEAEDKYRDAVQASADASRDIVKAQQAVTDASRATADARLKLADAEKELQAALAGPSEDERIDLEGARLSLQQAQKRASGQFADPLDRRRAQLDVRRARLDLTRAQGAHGERIADAQKAVADAQAGLVSAQQAEMDAQAGVVDARNKKAEASRNEAKAYGDIAIAQDGIRRAEEDLYTATYNLETAQSAFNAAVAAGKINGDAFLSFLDDLRNRYPEMSGVIGNYERDFGNMWNAAKGNTAPPAPPPAPPPQPLVAPDIKPYEATPQDKGDMVYIPGVGMRPRKKKAHGGPLEAFQSSEIGEKGMPELWEAGGRQFMLPPRAGRVTPLKPATIDVKGGDGVTIGDIYVQGAEDPVQTAYEVRRQMRIKTRGRGRT